MKAREKQAKMYDIIYKTPKYWYHTRCVIFVYSISFLLFMGKCKSKDDTVVNQSEPLLRCHLSSLTFEGLDMHEHMIHYLTQTSCVVYFARYKNVMHYVQHILHPDFGAAFFRSSFQIVK